MGLRSGRTTQSPLRLLAVKLYGETSLSSWLAGWPEMSESHIVAILPQYTETQSKKWREEKSVQAIYFLTHV